MPTEGPMHRSIRLAACAFAFAAATSAVAHAGAGGVVPARTLHVEPGSYLDEDRYESWFWITRRLVRDFDQICGDTFCEGEYTNIQSLRFACSVHRITGHLGGCGWSFAASDEWIGARGAIESSRVSWQCVAPIAPRTHIHDLIAALDVEAPLHAPIPGSGTTFFDVLADCL